MKINNEFDRRLELRRGKMPDSWRNALIDAVDTLDLCVSAAEALFPQGFTPDHVIAIYDRAAALRAADIASRKQDFEEM